MVAAGRLWLRSQGNWPLSVATGYASSGYVVKVRKVNADVLEPSRRDRGRAVSPREHGRIQLERKLELVVRRAAEDGRAAFGSSWKRPRRHPPSDRRSPVYAIGWARAK